MFHVYTIPDPVYTIPDPVHIIPHPAYTTPHPVYTIPHPVYTIPDPDTIPHLAIISPLEQSEIISHRTQTHIINKLAGLLSFNSDVYCIASNLLGTSSCD